MSHDKTEAARAIGFAAKYLRKKPSAEPEPVTLPPYSSYQLPTGAELTPVMKRALEYCQEGSRETGEGPEVWNSP